MKKVLALIMAAMMILSIAPMALAADAKVIGFSTTGPEWVAANFDGDLYNVTAERGKDKDMRFWIYNDDGTPANKQDISKGDIAVKTSYLKNSKAISGVSIQYSGGNAYVRVRFANKLVSTGDLDFEAKIILTSKKATIDQFTFEGTLKNVAAQNLYEDDEYVLVYDAPRMDAKEYIKNIEVDFGVGISLFTKMFEGKKYYAYATQAVKTEDEATIIKYPAIGSIYYLETIGLTTTGTTALIDVDDKLFVYDADLKYLGTTDMKLPYSAKYYVADQKLEIASDVIDAPVDIPTNPNMGGNDVPVNVNDNPGTGC